jgi:hypothetical protein
MKNNKLDRIEETLKEVAKEQRLFAKKMHQLQVAQEKTDKQIKATDKLVKNLAKQIGGVDRRLGKFVEGFAHYSVSGRLESFGIKIYKMYPGRVKITIKDKTLEIDTLCIAKFNGKDVAVLVEARIEINSEDIKDFIENQIKRFREFFPEYKDLDIIGVVAAMEYQGYADIYAEKQGLYVFVPNENIMIPKNKPDFKPKLW